MKTITLQIAQQMKELGFKQESEFYWCDSGDYRQKEYSSYKPNWIFLDKDTASSRRVNTKYNKFPDEQYSAYTLSELIDMCEEYFNHLDRQENGFGAFAINSIDTFADTPEEAVSQLLIALRTQKII